MRASKEAALPAGAADERTQPDDGEDVGVADTALARVRDVLDGVGIPARVERAGHAHDVLVIHAPPSALTTLHSASGALRALGFRYVTIDVTDA